MVKLIWATPAYLSVAWALMISYQLFTETAVKTLVASIGLLFPTAGFWLGSRIDMIVLIDAFAWIFVLSSVIPTIILGKERSVLVQFFVCLTLTLISFIILDTIQTTGGPLMNQLQGVAFLFTNPFFAILYLALPYIAMFIIDWRIKKRQKKLKTFEEINHEYSEKASANNHKTKGTQAKPDKKSSHEIEEQLP